MLDSQQEQLRATVAGPGSILNWQPLGKKWDTVGDLQDPGFLPTYWLRNCGSGKTAQICPSSHTSGH